MQDGTIISFTTITHPPKGFGDDPKTIGLIELSDGSRVMGQITASKRATSNEQLSLANMSPPISDSSESIPKAYGYTMSAIR